MSKRCPDCGFINEDSRIYCGSCGELLDADLRLIQSLEKQTTGPAKSQTAPRTQSEPEKPAPRRTSDDNYVSQKLAKEQKSSPVPWIILGIVAVVAVIAVIALM